MKYSIQAEQDGSAVAAEILLLRSASARTILVVEGSSDCKLMRAFVDLDACDFVIGWGKENCLDAMVTVNARPIAGVVAIIDRDFDDVLEQQPLPLNVMVFDDHDLETTLFRSSSLDKIVRELGSDQKVENRVSQGNDLRSDVLSVAHPLGVLRLYSQRNKLNLRFQGLRFRFLRKDLSFDRVELFKEVRNLSQRPDVTPDGFLKELDFWDQNQHDPWLICCGHDLCEVLGVALQSLWGTQNAANVTADRLESLLRVGFERDDFRKLHLLTSLREWEANNPPYRVLRSDL